MPNLPPQGSILITGANGGLGHAFLTHFLSSAPSTTHLGLFAVRNPTSHPDIQRTISEKISTQDGPNHQLVQVDFSTLDAVRSSAARINALVAHGTIPPIRALILNAAVQYTSGASYTPDGYEGTFAINYLANYLFVLLVLQSMDREKGRIVLLSSWTHDPYYALSGSSYVAEDQKEVLKGGDVRQLAKGQPNDQRGGVWRSGMRVYGASKTLLLMFMFSLQRRLDKDSKLSQISVLALDPLAMPTTFMARTSPIWIRLLLAYVVAPLVPLFALFSSNPLFRYPTRSAQDLMKAAFDVEGMGEHPKTVYLFGSERKQDAIGAEARDEGKQERLWAESAELAGLTKEDTVLQNWG